MKVAATLLVAVVAVASSSAVPQERYAAGAETYYGGTQQGYQSTPALYEYQWEVNDDYSGNFYGHREHRDGPITKGSYYVRLPDTRLMKVAYYVDEYGYHPTITYEGEAQYPQPTQGYQQHPGNTRATHPQPDLYL